MSTNPKVDKSFANARRWRDEADRLREILLDCGLTETLKWGKPCYTYADKNVCIIQRMNDFLALLFFKGALLKDPDKALEVQGPNSRAGYRMRFTSVRGVTGMADTIKAYVGEAIEVEKAGLKVEATADPDYPPELSDKFNQDPELKLAFEQLTPGRRRGYIFFIASAKQPNTRRSRIEKYRQDILDGKGLHDR